MTFAQYLTDLFTRRPPTVAHWDIVALDGHTVTITPQDAIAHVEAYVTAHQEAMRNVFASQDQAGQDCTPILYAVAVDLANGKS